MTADRQSPAFTQHQDAAKSRQDRLDALARMGGGMAHDFNNILHVIKNATELLRQKLAHADPDSERLIDMLSRNADRGKQLTGELLAFAARRPLHRVALNANREIADMQHRLREALGRGVHIETALGGSLWQVNADPAELQVVILKLAENARDAMSAGGKLTIETANAVMAETPGIPDHIPAGEYVCIAVRDHGEGMTPETLGRAFEPYFTTKNAGPMTGLGLSRVYGFAKQMDGRVAVESRLGFGTTVRLYLPRLQAGADADVPVPDRPESKVVALSAKPGGARGPKGLVGLRVLVVEDESLIGMLAEDLLEQLGCRMVGLVSSIGGALEMAKSTELDFALLDVDIGGQPVYPVALALQARGVPFLFMSGYGGLDGPWRGRPIVQKPFDLDQLRREIEGALAVGTSQE